ncbi:MAG: PAS domain-containing protein [Kofleriaceae bacterium]
MDVAEAVLERLPDAVIILDREFRFRYINPAAIALYEMTREELYGHVMWDVFPKAVGSISHVECLRVLATGETAKFETHYKPWNKWFESIVVPAGDGVAVHFRDITLRKHASMIVDGQRRALELALFGAQLPDILAELTHAVDQLASEGTMASIMLIENGRMHTGAAPRIAAAFSRAIDGLGIGPNVGSCGTAAHTGQLSVARDIQTDPRWLLYRGLAAAHDLRACWSSPIRASHGEIVGTFALYHSDVHEPDDEERHAVDVLSRTAAIVIERARTVRDKHVADDELRRVKAALAEIR